MQKYSYPTFPTDYSLILERCEAIHPAKYAKTRNFINGHVTYLSPYISRGVISIKNVLENILKKGYKLYESEKLIQELAWREYFQRVWQSKHDVIWEDLKQVQNNINHFEMPSALKDATTGINAIDEQIQQFYKTGYLHNHIRMYIAAIACNNAKAHWKLPSKWMYYHLLDGDIASNNCSWQWVGGSFSSKKYFCNQENINKYTGSDQFDTFLDKTYEEIVTMQVPDKLIATCILELKTNLPIANKPNIDFSKPTLIYNSYNLDPTWRSSEDVNRILLLEPSHFNTYPVSEKILDFLLSLGTNIPQLQVFTGEMHQIKTWYEEHDKNSSNMIISKEHPAFSHYPGLKDERDWLFPNVTGYYPSFFSYWKKCEKELKKIS